MTPAPISVWLDRSGELLRLRLARPKANIFDSAMIAAFLAALEEHADDVRLKAILVDADGPNFSYGASVEEHQPDQCAAMLTAIHELIRSIAASPVPVLAAVRGQCLGGGFEVAMAGHLMFAAPDAKFGQPEIKLGVFAPAASCILPERIGRMAAEDLLISGRSISADEALKMGLLVAVADDPEGEALGYFDTHIAPGSARSLRYAVAAARADFCHRLDQRLAEVERFYLDGLMSSHDAAEGIAAFIAKRPVKWKNR